MKFITDISVETGRKIAIGISVVVVLFALFRLLFGGIANSSLENDAIEHLKANCKPFVLPNLFAKKQNYEPECKGYKIIASKNKKLSEAEKLNGTKKKLCLVVEYAERINPKSSWSSSTVSVLVEKRNDGASNVTVSAYECESLKFFR